MSPSSQAKWSGEDLSYLNGFSWLLLRIIESIPKASANIIPCNEDDIIISDWDISYIVFLKLYVGRVTLIPKLFL